jgi:hypothetical protein
MKILVISIQLLQLQVNISLKLEMQFLSIKLRASSKEISANMVRQKRLISQHVSPSLPSKCIWR